MITILFFGQLADIAQQELGQSEINFLLSKKNTSITLNELCIELSKKSDLLSAELNKIGNLYAINQTLCHANNMNKSIVNAGDEVAFMSPLSGG